MMNAEWRDRIVAMVFVKQEIMKLDKEQIWPHHFPEVAATDEVLEKAETYLGFRLDQNYREFLGMANGWKGFYHTVDLFGAQELSGSPMMQYAKSLLKAVEDNVIQSTGFSREELLPIAATKYDKDLFVMARPESSAPGTVIWIAGEEIDRYPDFIEYFLSMLEYNRLLAKDLQENK